MLGSRVDALKRGGVLGGDHRALRAVQEERGGLDLRPDRLEGLKMEPRVALDQRGLIAGGEPLSALRYLLFRPVWIAVPGHVDAAPSARAVQAVVRTVQGTGARPAGGGRHGRVE